MTDFDARPTTSAPTDPRAPEARIGTIVEKYSLVRILGQGGMGAVYEARHATLSRRFAIKFLLPAAAANSDAVRRFENEAKAAGGIEHPNLVAVTDFGRDSQGAPYIVMEYLQGEDCAKLLGRLGPLPVARVANIVQQACRGLAVAHRAAIVHRDLKPANLFLTDAGDGSDLVKVLDFGIAKLKASESGVATGTGEAFGTAHYMSPEQARGAGEVDARTDVWSLGVVIYELLSGQKPFEDGTFLHVIYQILSTEPPSVGTLRKGLPPELVAVVAKAMAKDSRDRFPSVLALAQALAPFAAEGKSAGVAQRSQGFAATMATPATGIRPRGLGHSELDADLGRGEIPVTSRPVSGGGRVGAEATGTKLGRAKVAIAVVVLAMAAAAGVVWKLTGKQAAERGPTTGGLSHELGAGRAVAPLPAIEPPAAAPAPRSPTPPVASPPPEPPSSPAAEKPTERTVRPNVRLRTVRTVSERSEHGSNSLMAPGSVVPTAPLAPREVAAPVPKPAPLPETGSPGHPINIDETSPYGR